MGTTILLADDHVLVRQGFRALLEKHGYTVAAEASDGLEAVRYVQRQSIQIAILDFTMPLMNGIEAAREIGSISPSTKVILLTMHTEDQYVIEALRSGVTGYVLKSRAADGLLTAIREAMQGNFYLSPGISRSVVDVFRGKSNMPEDPLSSRERQVLQLIAEGKSTREVAELLHISVKTVESHRAHIMEKLNIKDLPSLVRYAIRRGLITP